MCNTILTQLTAQLVHWSIFKIVSQLHWLPITLKVYVDAISACHKQIEGCSLGKHVLVSSFVCGARWLWPVCRHQVPHRISLLLWNGCQMLS